MIDMQTDCCSAQIRVSREDWKTKSVIPCPNCPDGGVDLIHARAHSN